MLKADFRQLADFFNIFNALQQTMQQSTSGVGGKYSLTFLEGSTKTSQ